MKMASDRFTAVGGGGPWHGHTRNVVTVRDFALIKLTLSCCYFGVARARGRHVEQRPWTWAVTFPAGRARVRTVRTETPVGGPPSVFLISHHTASGLNLIFLHWVFSSWQRKWVLCSPPEFLWSSYSSSVACTRLEEKSLYWQSYRLQFPVSFSLRGFYCSYSIMKKAGTHIWWHQHKIGLYNWLTIVTDNVHGASKTIIAASASSAASLHQYKLFTEIILKSLYIRLCFKFPLLYYQLLVLS